VPKIEQRFLDCSIYLYASRQSAKQGDDAGGSGCLVSVDSPSEFEESPDGRLKATRYTPSHLYAVTNRHVIAHGYPVIRLNTIDGTTDILALEKDDWFLHPDGDDLAIAAIELPPIHEHAYYPIVVGQFVFKDGIVDVGAGDDVFMVGRFINHSGKQRNTPSLRFGSIAMLPFEKVKLSNGFMQEAFLVESRSISGYSGSPVFVYKPVIERIETPKRPFDLRHDWSSPRGYVSQHTVTDLVGRPQLLGIDCGHIPKHEKVVNGAGTPHPHGWRVDTNTGMAVVIPAWRLYEFLNSNDLVIQRKEKDEEYLKEKERESSVVADTEKPDVPFTSASYEDVLRRASSQIPEHDSEKTSE
jgi:hypothetical protein